MTVETSDVDVLFVEDNEMNRRVVKDMLAVAGVNVAEALCTSGASRCPQLTRKRMVVMRACCRHNASTVRAAAGWPRPSPQANSAPTSDASSSWQVTLQVDTEASASSLPTPLRNTRMSRFPERSL